MRASIFATLAVAACAPEFDAAEAEGDESLIINGVAASEYYTTSTVALVYRDGARITEPYCSGVLIRPDLVLTAAHCADFVTAGQVAIHVAQTVPTYPNARTYFVSDIDVHPSWNPRTLANDVAAFHLATDVTQKVTMFPVLPSTLSLNNNDVGADAMVMGFGADEFGGSGVRERAFVEIADVSLTPGIVYTDGSVSSVCFGDSGGPMFVLKARQAYVAGINSFVGDDYCSSYSGHTRLDRQTSFLGTL